MMRISAVSHHAALSDRDLKISPLVLQTHSDTNTTGKAFVTSVTVPGWPCGLALASARGGYRRC
jgi:hypothetical protein